MNKKYHNRVVELIMEKDVDITKDTSSTGNYSYVMNMGFLYSNSLKRHIMYGEDIDKVIHRIDKKYAIGNLDMSRDILKVVLKIVNEVVRNE